MTDLLRSFWIQKSYPEGNRMEKGIMIKRAKMFKLLNFSTNYSLNLCFANSCMSLPLSLYPSIFPFLQSFSEGKAHPPWCSSSHRSAGLPGCTSQQRLRPTEAFSAYPGCQRRVLLKEPPENSPPDRRERRCRQVLALKRARPAGCYGAFRTGAPAVRTSPPSHMEFVLRQSPVFCKNPSSPVLVLKIFHDLNNQLNGSVNAKHRAVQTEIITVRPPPFL